MTEFNHIARSHREQEPACVTTPLTLEGSTLVSNGCGRVARTQHTGAHRGNTYRLEREREGSLRDQYVI
jgi:hypothetical protein